MSKLINTVAAACGALTLFAGAAQAQDAKQVRFGDLNLGSAEGAAELDRRISRAGAVLCQVPANVTQTAIRKVGTCKADVRAQAMSALPRAQADAYMAAKRAPTLLAAR
jgi:UrcA family protein